MVIIQKMVQIDQFCFHLHLWSLTLYEGLLENRSRWRRKEESLYKRRDQGKGMSQMHPLKWGAGFLQCSQDPDT